MDWEVRYKMKVPMIAPSVIPTVRTTVLMVANVLAAAFDLSRDF